MPALQPHVRPAPRGLAGPCFRCPEMPHDRALTLADVRYPTLSIECNRCNRHRRYVVAKLIDKHGDARLTELRVVLADCPKARYANMYARCWAFYEGLAVRQHARREVMSE